MIPTPLNSHIEGTNQTTKAIEILLINSWILIYFSPLFHLSSRFGTWICREDKLCSIQHAAQKEETELGWYISSKRKTTPNHKINCSLHKKQMKRAIGIILVSQQSDLVRLDFHGLFTRLSIIKQFGDDFSLIITYFFHFD